ncbi:hypothetical protein HZS93_03614 [Xanthomonas citri]|nr:hypothetical protein HZS93_03614 [Xanthomonas citri]
MAEQDAVHDVSHAAGAALWRQTKQQRGQPSRCQLTHAWLGINAPAQSLQPCASQQRTRHAAHHARLCRFPIPACEQHHTSCHARTCNRLQAFREGMCTTFVAILSFSPAAATGTT